MREFGVEHENFRHIAKTGLIADICGKGEPVPVQDGKIDTIVLRTELDALLMKEENPHLSYKSKTPYAHMCGHDGHMAMVLAAA